MKTNKMLMNFYGGGMTTKEEMYIIDEDSEYIQLCGDEEGNDTIWKFDKITGDCLNDNTFLGCKRSINVDEVDEVVEESVIKTSVTKDNIIIKIPNEFIINTFNEDFDSEEYKIKYKNKFLKEFADEIVEQLINNDIIVSINEYLADSDNVKWLGDEED